MKYFLLGALLLGQLLTLNATAQTPLGQPTLDEQKVQVWCATARFVYEDNGRPNLKNTLKCGGTLKEFERSIRADSQRVFSALYQPLEGRGAIYKGLGSNPSRLQKLKTEIINRLKSSPARRASTARMARLATLETALTNYVDNGTPISSQAEEATEATGDLEGEEMATDNPTDAGLAEAGVAQQPEPAQGSGEGLMSKLFAPLAFVLALLSLVLYALMRRNLAVFQQELATRMTTRQDEIMASRPAPAAPSISTAAPVQTISPELQLEVELLVQQRVAAELAKRELLTEKPAALVATPEPVAPIPQAPLTVATPVATVVPAPAVAPVTPEVATETPAAATAVEAPTPLTEIPAPPVVLPLGSPATALREEFESVVPPVPATELETEPAAVQPEEPVVSMTTMRYAKASVNGKLDEADFTDELQADSVYEIYQDSQWPALATFQVSMEPAVQTYLLQIAPPELLADACEYEAPTGPVSEILTLEEGVLRKVDGVWQVEQKAVVQFEG
jgi:hypothetical protein